MEAWIKL